jgi:hypothetical protein
MVKGHLPCSPTERGGMCSEQSDSPPRAGGELRDGSNRRGGVWLKLRTAVARFW